MIKPNRLARHVALCVLVPLLLQCRGAVLAGPCLEYPCEPGCMCTPNAAYFGHFETMWRQWPGRPAQDVAFPQSIGAEVIPTPAGQKQQPLPKPTLLPLPGEGPAVEGPLPEIPMPGEILPPEGGFRLEGLGPPAVPPVPEVPGGEPAAEPILPDGPPETPNGSATPSLPEPPAEEPLLPSNSDGSSDSAKLAAKPVADEPEPVPFHAQQITEKDDSQQHTPTERTERTEPVPQPVGDESGPVLPPLVSQPAPEPAPEPSERPQAKPLQANWMAALHPGFRGDAGRMMATDPPRRPARPLMPQAAAESQSLPPASVDYQLQQLKEQPASYSEEIRQADSPPVALDGFCPVELLRAERWVPGNPASTVVYQGRTYLFSGPARRLQFVADPRRYTPMYSGHDPVLIVDGGRRVLGQTDYCVTYEGRLYMFSSSVTLAQFRKNPEAYTTAVGE